MEDCTLNSYLLPTYARKRDNRDDQEVQTRGGIHRPVVLKPSFHQQKH